MGRGGAARQGSEWVVGVAGSLQFDVLAHRIQNEYDVPVVFEGTRVHAARWIDSEDAAELKRFRDENAIWMAEDHNGSPVYLAPDAWRLKIATEDWPKIRFLTLKEQVPQKLLAPGPAPGPGNIPGWPASARADA